MATDDVLLTNIKLEGASQVQDQLRRIGDEGQRAFNKLSEAANQRFDQVSTALVKVSQSLDRVANTRVEINTDRANQALENISRVADQLSRQLERLGQPGSRSLQNFNQTAQQTRQEVTTLEGAVTSAFNNISKEGVSAFTLINNTIQDSIRLFENYKKTALTLVTGGIIGGIVKGINDAVDDFNKLKTAASSSGIKFDEYQKLNFLLRDMGVSAKSAEDLLGKMGQRAKDLKAVVGDGKGITVTSGDTRKFFPVDEEGRVGRASVIEDTKKLAELNAKLASGGFGDKNSFEALHKYRLEVDAMRAAMLAAEQSSGRTITIPDAGAKKLGDAIKNFDLEPTTENLRKLVDEVNKLGDSAKRVEAFKQAFGGSEEAAKALEQALNTETLDQYIARQQKLQVLRESDAKSTETLEAANKKLNAALFEFGFASEQGRISLGLMFAPALAPAIDAIAQGIRGLNINMRTLASDIGKDIGPAITQLFNLFKEGGKDFVSLAPDNMFKGFVDGLKAAKDFVGPIITDIKNAVVNLFTFISGQASGVQLGGVFTSFFTNAVEGFRNLMTAIQPALDAVNEFFGTKFTGADVGLGILLSSLTGGFTTLGLVILSVFGKSKDSLKEFGIDIDELIRKAKVFGTEFSTAVGQIFESKADRKARLEKEKEAGEAADKPNLKAQGLEEADQGVKDLARDFVDLGEIVLGVVGAFVGLRRAMVFIGTFVGIEKLTGLFSGLLPIIQGISFGFAAMFFAASAVLRTLQTLGVVFKILSFSPLLTLVGIFTLLIVYSEDVMKALDGVAESINKFLTRMSGGLIPEGVITGARLFGAAMVLLSTILGVVLINAIANVSRAIVAFGALLGVEVTWAAGLSLLALLGRIALSLGTVIQLYNDLTHKPPPTEAVGDFLTKQLAAGKISVEEFNAAMKRLNETFEKTGQIPPDLLKGVTQDPAKIAEINKQIEELDKKQAERLAARGGFFGRAPTIEERDRQIEEDARRSRLQKELGAETSKPTLEEIQRQLRASQAAKGLQPDVSPDQTKLDEGVKTTEDKYKSLKDRLQEMFKGTDIGADLDKLLTAPTATPKIPELKAGPDEEIITINGKPYKVKKAKPDDKASDASEISKLVQVASLDPSSGIAGRGRGQESAATPAQDALAASTRNLDSAEGTLKSSIDALNASLGTLQVTITNADSTVSSAANNLSTALATAQASLENLTAASGSLAEVLNRLLEATNGLTQAFNSLLESARSLAETFSGMLESVNALAEAFSTLLGAVNSLAEAFGTLTSSAGSLDSAMRGAAGSASDLTAVMDGLISAVSNAINALNQLGQAGQGGPGAEVVRASDTTGGPRAGGPRTATVASTGRTVTVPSAETGEPVEVEILSSPGRTPEQRAAARKRQEERARQERAAEEARIREERAAEAARRTAAQQDRDSFGRPIDTSVTAQRPGGTSSAGAAQGGLGTPFRDAIRKQIEDLKRELQANLGSGDSRLLQTIQEKIKERQNALAGSTVPGTASFNAINQAYRQRQEDLRRFGGGLVGGVGGTGAGTGAGAGFTGGGAGIGAQPGAGAGAGARSWEERVRREQAAGMRQVEQQQLEIKRLQLQGLKDMPGDRGIFLREQVRESIKEQQRSMRRDEGVRELEAFGPRGPGTAQPGKREPIPVVPVTPSGQSLVTKPEVTTPLSPTREETVVPSTEEPLATTATAKKPDPDALQPGEAARIIERARQRQEDERSKFGYRTPRIINIEKQLEENRRVLEGPPPRGPSRLDRPGSRMRDQEFRDLEQDEGDPDFGKFPAIRRLSEAFSGLQTALASLGGTAVETSTQVGETSDAFADWAAKTTDVQDKIEKRPPATQMESEIEDARKNLEEDFKGTAKVLELEMSERLGAASKLAKDAGVDQIGPVRREDRSPTDVPRLDLPKIPEIPGITPEFEGTFTPLIEGLKSSLNSLGAAAQSTSQALQPLAPALDQASTAAQSTTQALEPVTPALEQVSTSAQSVPQDVEQADQAFEQIDFGQAVQEVQQFVQEINQSFQNLTAPSGGEGAATGGLITGPGSDTSDSIPILASANEFMMRAAAVRHYGRDFMYRVNSMSFPRLAMGGLVDILNTPLSGQIRLPRFAEGGSIQPSSGGVPVHVNFEGRRVFSASAQRSSIEQLKRESLLQKVRSGGPSPFWVD